MKSAYIFHDSFSDPFSDWYPWMKTTLEARGYVVTVPRFPTPAGQSLESWRVVAGKYAEVFDNETIVIGHGTGAMFALRMVQWSGKQIRGLYLVAGYAEKIGHAGYDRVNATFFADEFPWETIRSRAMVARAVVGDNDPFVPRQASDRVAQSLGIAVDVIADGGHLNKASGFEQFVALASMVQEGEGMIGAGMEVEKEMSEQYSDPSVISLQNGDTSKSGNVGNATSPLQGEDPALSGSNQPPSAAHTMYQDMSMLVNSNRGSITSSLLEHARQEEKIAQETSPTSSKNIFYLIGSLILLMVAVGIIGYVVAVYLPARQNAAPRSVPSLLSAQAHQAIDVSRPSYAIAEQMRAAMTVAPADGSIHDLYYVIGAARAPFPNVLTALDITTLPEKLAAEFLQPMFMHGVAGTDGPAAHFLVLPVASYDTAFAGMREWEPTMFRDLGAFMNVPDSFLKTRIAKDAFVSEVIANRNLRVLRYQQPAMVASEPEPVPAVEIPAGDESASTVPDAVSPESPNFISTGIAAVAEDNPFLNVIAPYDDGQVMMAYFFLTERVIVIVDDLDIIPEILSRYANRQIYQ